MAAKFACEQLLGMPDPEIMGESERKEYSNLLLSLTPCTEAEKDLALFASSLLSHGEYQRSAHIIRAKAGRILFFGESVPSCSSRDLRFLAAYSLYMAGEKRKSQMESEASGISLSIYIYHFLTTHIQHARQRTE